MRKKKIETLPPFTGRCIGIDLGIANNGAAVVDGIKDADVKHLEYFGTSPARDSRQMLDDWRRIELIIDWAYDFVLNWKTDHELTVVRFEWFSPRFNMTRGWNTATVAGAIGAAVRARLLEHQRGFLHGDVGPGGYEVLPSKPPLHVQVSTMPTGWHFNSLQRDHVLDGLTHARLEWARRGGV